MVPPLCTQTAQSAVNCAPAVRGANRQNTDPFSHFRKTQFFIPEYEAAALFFDKIGTAFLGLKLKKKKKNPIECTHQMVIEACRKSK